MTVMRRAGVAAQGRRYNFLLRRSTHQLCRPSSSFMAATLSSNKVFIRGITRDGRTFRPSDWAERLAGVMAQFRPGGAGGLGGHIAYSPWCVPTTLDGAKCVVVSRALRDHEPMAWDFVMGFARDNELQVIEACLVPDAAAPESGSNPMTGADAP